MKMKKGLATAKRWVEGKMAAPCKPLECNKKEDNLRKLAGSSVLSGFVRENNGCWDHQKWLELCDKISKNGYLPVDFDQVGLMLEQEKASYFSQK